MSCYDCKHWRYKGTDEVEGRYGECHQGPPPANYSPHGTAIVGRGRWYLTMAIDDCGAQETRTGPLRTVWGVEPPTDPTPVTTSAPAPGVTLGTPAPQGSGASTPSATNQSQGRQGQPYNQGNRFQGKGNRR